jgi:hypothetical protein
MGTEKTGPLFPPRRTKGRPPAGVAEAMRLHGKAEKKKAHLALNSRRVGFRSKSTAKSGCTTRSGSYLDVEEVDGWLAAFCSISSEKRLPLG